MDEQAIREAVRAYRLKNQKATMQHAIADAARLYPDEIERMKFLAIWGREHRKTLEFNASVERNWPVSKGY